MNLIQLDTNALIALLDPNGPVYLKMHEACKSGLLPSTSSLAWHELVRGPISTAELLLIEGIVGERVIPMTRSTAELGARLFNSTGRRRSATADCLIAACAMENRSHFVTLNPADFKPFEPFGLSLMTLS